MSANGVVKMMEDNSDAALIASVLGNWGLYIADDIVEIKEMQASLGLSYALARVVSKNHTVIGWTTHGHTCQSY